MPKERVTMNENDYAYAYRNCTQVTKTKTTIMKTIEVVAAIIQHEGKYLATQRGYGEWKGFWEYPGGKIEPGEAREEASSARYARSCAWRSCPSDGYAPRSMTTLPFT